MKTDDALLGTTVAEVILTFSSTSMMQHDVVCIGATALHHAFASSARHHEAEPLDWRCMFYHFESDFLLFTGQKNPCHEGGQG